jgi:hypothetical protein
MSPTSSPLFRRLPRTDCQTWNVLKRVVLNNADLVRMLGSTRYALKYHHPVACLPEILPTGSYCRSYSKSTAISKPTITKKKYSELPTLRPLCKATPNAVLGSEIATNTHRARHPRILECVCLSLLQGCLLTWLSASRSFQAGISNLSSTHSQPLSTYGTKSSLIKGARRTRVQRNDNAEDTSIPESTEPSNSTPLARNAAVRQKRGSKASQPIPMGEWSERRCLSAAKFPDF